MSAFPAIGENGAPCEPRFFARAAWLAAIPLAWACSLAIVLGVQGLSGAVHEARGPAHYHAADGSHEDEHHHAGVERHHHASGAQIVVVGDTEPGGQSIARAVKGGFDVLPFAFNLPSLHRASGERCGAAFLISSPEPFFACERPPASARF